MMSASLRTIITPKSFMPIDEASIELLTGPTPPSAGESECGQRKRCEANPARDFSGAEYRCENADERRQPRRSRLGAGGFGFRRHDGQDLMQGECEPCAIELGACAQQRLLLGNRSGRVIHCAAPLSA